MRRRGWGERTLSWRRAGLVTVGPVLAVVVGVLTNWLSDQWTWGVFAALVSLVIAIVTVGIYLEIVDSRSLRSRDAPPTEPAAPVKVPTRPGSNARIGLGRRKSSSGDLPAVWNVEPRNPEFTGRNEALVALRERLRAGGTAVVQALRGLGGVGKTQIAVEYAHRFAADYDLVWWVTAEDPALIGEQMAALAVELGLVDAGEDTAPAVAVLKAHLRGRDRWLLVFDNAVDSACIREWLPGGRGHVVITSRAGGWSHIAATMGVDVMSRAESVALLRTHNPDLSLDDADRLAIALGDLPLALVQAGGFLAETATSVDDYLRLLDHQAGSVLAEGSFGDYPRPLAAAIRLSTDRLAQVDPVGLAAIRLCAVLAPETVPVNWLVNTPHVEESTGPLAAFLQVAEDPVALRRGVGSIDRLGLATSTRDGVRLHRLIQAVVCDQLSPADREKVREHARALLVDNDPGDPEDPATWPTWAKMVPHLLAVDPANSSTNNGLRKLCCSAAWYLIERGDADAGARLASEIYQRWRVNLGPDDYHTLWAARALGRALREQGHVEEARPLYEDTLVRYRRVLGDDHPDTLRLAHGFAIDLHLLGDYEQARALQEDTMNRYQRVLGRDHHHALHSANHLADDLRALGEHDQARQLHEDTLVRYRRVLGDDHPDTLRSANNLAIDLRQFGQHERARELLEDTLARRRRVLGDDHPHTLQSANNLAETLHLLGKCQRARELQEDTLARRWQVLGDDHPDTLISSRNLAAVLSALGQHERSRRLQEEIEAKLVRRANQKQVMADSADPG
jgi:tetratricopeptide (TPR) repeat protein